MDVKKRQPKYVDRDWGGKKAYAETIAIFNSLLEKNKLQSIKNKK
jgi:hypothetical protein